ncbi:LacI family DNA-binding transcriptional regulator [Utexia brackfieldae]|uniref:LacI family DNA-binding transcriptional regulator n=1 Tax=Utexia brackfieldae TaxID=3074108 RepID=UPI00370D0B02
MKKYKSVTMQDIANRANVSVATVSRVINTPAKTSPQLQFKVHQAIEQLNYNTSELIKPYQTHYQNKKILLIDNQYFPHSMVNRGIEDTAQKQGYKIIYLRFLYFSPQDIQQIINYTVHHQIEGILIINDSPYLSQLEQYSAALPPIVLLNHYSRTLSCVYFDHMAIAYQATNYLLEQGHRHIACLFGLKDKQSTVYMTQGYQQALQRKALPLNTHYLQYNATHFHATQALFSLLLKQPIPPTAIFCDDNRSLSYHDLIDIQTHQVQPESGFIDEHTIINGIMTQAKKLKCQLPQQVSIITVNAHSQSQMPTEPLMTHIYKPMYKMGCEGFMMLISKTAKIQQHACYQSLVMPTELVIRHSVINKNL